MKSPNTQYPVKQCACGREFAYVRGHSESDQVCGFCLAEKAQKEAK